MNISKKLLSFVLAFLIVFVGLPICNIVKAEDEYIYLSDIYYAYPSYITKTTVLRQYNDEAINLMYVTLDHYLNSDSFADTEAKTVMQNNPANVVDYIQMFLSGYFGANYVKNDAIELANELFAQKLLKTNSVENATAVDEFAEKVITLYELYEDFTETVEERGQMTSVEVIELAKEKIKNSTLMSHLQAAQLDDMLTDLIPNLKVASDVASIGGDMIKLGKTIMFATLLEDERLNIINDVVNNATNDTLRTGMQRLANEINADFGGYIVKNYVFGGLFEKLADMVIDKIVDGLTIGNATLVGLVGLAFEISAGIIFGDTPSLNEIMLQMVLTDYVSGLQSAVTAYDNDFGEKALSFDDVQTHQNLVTALQAATELAIEKTKPLAVFQSDIDNLAAFESKWVKNFNLYKGMMNDVRGIISACSKDDLERTYYNSWEILNDVTASHGSDIIRENEIYFTDGTFNGNISVGNSKMFTAPDLNEFTVNGNIKMSHSSKLANNGTLTVTGNLQRYTSGAGTVVNNNGRINVGGATALDTLNMTEEAVTAIGGSVEVDGQITDGTILMNGITEQIIEELSCHNLEVENTAGIRYYEDIYVSGEYNLNGNPLSSSYSAVINSSNVKFDPDSNYKNLKINSDVELVSSVKGNIEISNNASLTVAEGKDIVIDGNVKMNHSATITNNGTLTVTGNLQRYTSGAGTVVNNNGRINVLGVMSVDTVNMTEKGAVAMSDITGDGKTNIIALIRMKKNMSNGTNTDINLDGKANIYDMTFVRKALLGIYEILSPRVISH